MKEYMETNKPTRIIDNSVCEYNYDINFISITFVEDVFLWFTLSLFQK
jgi:hypothetical protein